MARVRGPIAASIAARIDRDALVDVDDQRDRADGQHRCRGRHVGVGRDDHLVARTEPDGGHRRGERVAAAGGEREVLDAEMFGVSRLEPFALVADAIAEQRAGADHSRDRVDLFLADLVHALPPGSCAATPCLWLDANTATGPTIEPLSCPSMNRFAPAARRFRLSGGPRRLSRNRPRAPPAAKARSCDGVRRGYPRWVYGQLPAADAGSRRIARFHETSPATP